MLDDLRTSATYNDEEEEIQQEEIVARRPRRNSGSQILGMTATQRFVIVLMLFLMVCVFGLFALMVFDKIAIPFF